MKTGKRMLSLSLVVMLLITAVPLTTISKATAAIINYQVGDIIEFGTYPQKKVTDTSLIETLNSIDSNWYSYEYYSGTGSNDGTIVSSDFMQYCDVELNNKKYRAVRFSKYRPAITATESSADNSNQDDNGYMTDTMYWFVFEPITWKVLNPDNGMVLCEKILDAQAYNNYVVRGGTDPRGSSAYWGDAEMSHYASDYENSSLRYWLTHDFYDTAFTEAQKEKIAENYTQNNNCFFTLNGGTDYTDFDSNPTDDKVFLLSVDEVRNESYGFSPDANTSDTKRIARGTDYAKCQGLTAESSDTLQDGTWWWLRTPGIQSFLGCDVSGKGYLSTLIPVNHAGIGIRPAICIDLENIDDEQEPYEITISPAGDYKIQNGSLYKNTFSLHTQSFYDEEVAAIDLYLYIKNNNSDYLASNSLNLYAICFSYAGVELLGTDTLIDNTIDSIPYGQTYTCRLYRVFKENLLSLANNRDVQLVFSIAVFNEAMQVEDYPQLTETVNVNYSLDNAVFPNAYDFSWDSYSFDNINETIDKSYYIDRYGKNIGKKLFSNHEKGDSHGHCFGMATTTASYLQNSPDKSGYIRLIEKDEPAVFQASFGWISALDYIKNAHIYQYSAEVNNARKLNTGIESVKQAVAENIQNNKPVVIEFFNKSGETGHTVLAVGIDGDNILINDSNDPDYLHRIVVDGSSWSYSCAGLNYDDEKTDISWFDGYTNIYQSLVKDGKFEYNKNRLVTSSASVIFEDSDDVIRIRSAESNGISDEPCCYWIKDGGTFKTENVSDETGTITVTSNSQIISTTMASQASVDFDCISEDRVEIQMDGQDIVDIAFDFTEDDEINSIHITGDANEDEVNIQANGDSVSVQGLNDVSVSYIEDGTEKSVKTVSVKDGRQVDITIDEPNSDVILAHEHDYKSSIMTAATCTAEGVETYVCSICDNTYTKPIGKTAHTLTTINQKNADCTTAGYTGDQYCTVCKQTISTGSATNALGHTAPDGNGNCTRCGTHIKDVTPSQPQTNPNACKWCGKVHSGFFQSIVGFFHRILAAIFGAKY